MELIDLLKKYKEERIIKLIRKNKIEYSNEEILYEAITFDKNKLVKYIIENEDVDLKYKNKNNISILEVATMDGNLFALDLLKKHNLSLYKEYKLKNNTSFNNLYYIRDLDTLKYFENNIDKKILKKNLEPIIFNTLPSSDIELLNYIIENYKIGLNELQDNIMSHVESFKGRMKERENRLSDQVFFVLNILPDKRKYKAIRDNALKRLDLIVEENERIKKYYDYVKKCYEEEK